MEKINFFNRYFLAVIVDQNIVKIIINNEDRNSQDKKDCAIACEVPSPAK